MLRPPSSDFSKVEHDSQNSHNDEEQDDAQDDISPPFLHDHSLSSSGSDPTLNSDSSRNYNFSALKRAHQARVRPELKAADLEESFVRGRSLCIDRLLSKLTLFQVADPGVSQLIKQRTTSSSCISRQAYVSRVKRHVH